MDLIYLALAFLFFLASFGLIAFLAHLMEARS